MSGYLRSHSIEFPFDGTQVTFQVKPLKRRDTAQLIEGQPSNVEMIDRFSKMLGEYVESYNVRDASGALIPLEVIAEDVYFTSLLADLMSKMMERSQPKNLLPSNKTSNASLLEGDPSTEKLSQDTTQGAG